MAIGCPPEHPRESRPAKDPRFLRGEGRYVENLPLEGAVGHVRPLAARARSHRRSRRLGRRGAPERAGLDRGRSRPRRRTGRRRSPGSTRPWGGRSSRGTSSASSATSSRSWSATTARPARTRPSSSWSTTSRCRPSSRREDAAKDEMLLFPEAGTNVAARSGSPEPRREAVRRLRRRRLGHGRQPAHGAVPARAALVPPPSSGPTGGSPPGSRRRRRTRTGWGSPRRSGSSRRRSGSIAPDVGGGFGAKIAQRRGAAGRLACAQARPADALDRDAQREHGRAAHGRAQRLDFTIGGTRDGKVLAYRLDVAAGRRRVPDARCVPAEPDGADGERRLRDPADRVRGPLGGDEHDADVGLPRRGPARGDAGDRARDRHVRRRARAWIPPRSGGGTSSRRTRSRTRP